jgi:hypothetical protein
MSTAAQIIANRADADLDHSLLVAEHPPLAVDDSPLARR